MDGLLLCQACNHGASLHDGSGCDVRRCTCRLTRETIVAHVLALAKDDIHNAYRQVPAE